METKTNKVKTFTFSRQDIIDILAREHSIDPGIVTGLTSGMDDYLGDIILTTEEEIFE